MYIEVYKVNGCVLYFNTQFPGIVLEGSGYVGSEVFRDMCERALALLGEKQSSKLLVDVREMVNISFADQQWAIRQWVPRLIKAGLANAAIINSRHYFHRIAVEAIVKTISRDQMEIRHFNDKLSAEAWLQSA